MALDPQAEELHAAVMAVAHALSAEERTQFLAKTSRWPGMDGAEVADILAMTIDHDEFLNETEAFFATFADQLPECGNFGAIAALHALVILGRPLTPARVTALLQKAGVTEAPRYPEIEAGIRNEDGSDANALLISARAEQAMRAAGKDEDLITAYRQAVRRTSVPGHARNVADIAVWVTLADKFTPLARAIYDLVPDLVALVEVAAFGDYRHRTSPRTAAALANLREHLDLTSSETLEQSMRALLAKGTGA